MDDEVTRRLLKKLASDAVALDDEIIEQTEKITKQTEPYTGDQVVRLIRALGERVIAECRLCVVLAYELGFRQGMAPGRSSEGAPPRRRHLYLVRDRDADGGAR